MDCSMPGFLVHHQVPELTQTHVHWISDAIQPSLPLLSSSPPAFNLSQHQGLFLQLGSSHQVAKVLELQIQHQSFQWIFRTNILYNWLVWSPGNPGSLKSLSQQHSSKTSILWCSAFCMVQLSHPYIDSVQFSCSVMSDSLQPPGLQHTRLLCPSTSPRAYSNSCPLSQWCHPTNFPAVVPLSSCLQSLPASGSFLMSKLFKSGDQGISTLLDSFPIWSLQSIEQSSLCYKVCSY